MMQRRCIERPLPNPSPFAEVLTGEGTKVEPARHLRRRGQ